MKKILALLLTLCMAFSFVPTSLLAFGVGTVTHDITDTNVISKLTVNSAVNTKLTTQFNANAFENRKNILKNTTEFKMYTDATQTSEVTYENDAAITWSHAAMYDGIIPTSTTAEPTKLTSKSNKTKQSNGYLTIGLDKSYDIGDIYIASRDNGKDSLYDYEIYVSDSRENLYDESNLIVDFLYEGYTTTGNVGKINKVSLTGEKNAEVEDFKFSTPVVGQYVGIKMNSFSHTGYIRVYEIGIEEFEYFKLDESQLNVNMHINPLCEKITEETVDEYSFKVSVDNDGVVERLYVDGAEITPDPNGVYTILNATKKMVLTADLKLDNKKTIHLGIGSDQTQRNITWHTTSNTVGSVQYAEKSGNLFPNTYKQVSANVTVSKNDLGYYINRATIKNLKPNTEYVYRVVNDEASQIYTFKTSAQDKFSFLFAGDPQLGANGLDSSKSKWTANITKIINALPNTNMLFTAGDQVNVADNEQQYEAFFAPQELPSLTNSTTIGNHDAYSIAYSEHFTTPNNNIEGVVYGGTEAGGNYWFTYNNTLFININTNSYSGTEHRAFIQKAVELNPDVTWKVVITHYCIYTGGSYYNESAITNRREMLVPIFTEFGIDVVLSGHNHSYTRSHMMNEFTPDTSNGVQSKVVDPTGILYITANSASGSKYNPLPDADIDYVAVNWQSEQPSIINVDITASTFKMTTYNVSDMSVVDTFQIEKTIPHTHTPTHVEETSASCGNNGNIEYWYCEGCNTKFGNEECTSEITNTVINATGNHKQVTATTKATTSKNGAIKYTCSVCKKATKTATTIYYPKTVKLSTTTYTYNGKVKKPSVKVTGSNGKTISSSNYTVSYASGRKYPGKYKVTVKFKGNYSGTKTLYFKVKPKKTTIKSVKSSAKKKATVKWSKQSKVSGYQILLATNKKFTKGKKTVTVKGSSSKSKTIKSLKSKKTYYVKVRAYKTIDGKKVYGSYSKYKKVKVK